MTTPVYERILHLLEAEGIKTLFGIPDPGFVHMASTAEMRGWQVIAPHHEQAGAYLSAFRMADAEKERQIYKKLSSQPATSNVIAGRP